MIKKRLDVVVHEKNPSYSKRQIQSFIMQGKVTVEGKVLTKAGTMVHENSSIIVDIHEPKYVSRAGFKLAGALDAFNVDVKGLVALDAGLSTGGFTDCLLQQGVSKVYGVDVGYGQAHEKIRADHRVVVMERVNLRELTTLPEKVDLVTLDLSFISVLKVIQAVHMLMKPEGKLIVLIKPQFEAQRKDIARGGIVKNPEVHARVIQEVTAGIENAGFLFQGVIESPIEGATGNKEFLAYFIQRSII